MKRTRILIWLWKALVVITVLFAILEIGLRVTFAVRNSMVTETPLPYVIGHDYGPLPPWLEDNMIFAPDEDLIWKNRPNLRRRYVDIFSPVATDEMRRSLLRRFRPSLPAEWEGNPTWEIVLNSQGFRDDEVAAEKPASSFRIACLGDSWTFGMNVGQDQPYPQRLKALLEEAYPGSSFEVLNRGVLGYSSHQGLELLKKRVLDLSPDLVVIAFAMNDSKDTGYHDRDLATSEKALSLTEKASRLLKRSETYRLVRYALDVWSYEPQPIDHYLRAESGDEEQDEPDSPVDLDERDAWTQKSRVPPADYEKNIREMIELARSRKASVVLVYNELWEDGPYKRVLQRIAQTEGVPLVDSSALIAQARRQKEEALEKELGLVPARDDRTSAGAEVEVVFRVHQGKREVSRALYLAAAHPKLGDAVPNKVAMYDDGTHGDQKAGDGVWSFTATFKPGTTLHYVYTNSGANGKWEGLDVPHIREFKVEAGQKGRPVYRPIETFGEIYLQADAWHPNAVGYDLIAGAVLDVLKQQPEFQKHVRR